MAVSLKKGQKVSLTKDNEGLNTVMVGLGWDEVKASKGLFSRKQQDIDCDASALLCQDGKVVRKEDIVYFGNLRHQSGAVQHMGDNLTGAGDGDDEQVLVELKKIPESYDKIVFVVNIYQAQKRNQHFGMVKNCFIRIVDGRNNQELLRYDLSENYDQMTALIFGEVYRHNDEWKFSAIGQATQDDGLGQLVSRFQ